MNLLIVLMAFLACVMALILIARSLEWFERTSVRRRGAGLERSRIKSPAR